MENNENQCNEKTIIQQGYVQLPDSMNQTIAAFFHRFCIEQYGFKLHHHKNTWTKYSEGKYQVFDEEELRKYVGNFVSKCWSPVKGVLKPLNVSKTRTTNIMLALSSSESIWIPEGKIPPVWLSDDMKSRAEDTIGLNNCLLDISQFPPSRLEFTEDFYTLHYLPFDNDPTATCPEFENFLMQIFEDDNEEVERVQEMFGYLVSNETQQQKIFCLVGPKRSGKGTIGKVIRWLIGEGNYAAPTLTSMNNNFGLQNLMSKKVAIIGDSATGRDTQKVVEKLKLISGEDAVNVNQKFEKEVTLSSLPVRFVIMANELLELKDPSGALACRLLFICTRQSFAGREDPNLDEKLKKEVQGIFNWALTGLQRLRERGHFSESVSGSEMHREFEAVSSEIMAFVNNRCTLGPGLKIETEWLFKAYQEFCTRQGRACMKKQTFCRKLREAYPKCKRTREGKERGYFYAGIALKR